jgi:hypothetical protein
MHLAEEVGAWLPVGTAVEGATWNVDSPPPGNDPSLNGRITNVGLRIAGVTGAALNVLQLDVDQLLGDYRGYSGSGVLDSTTGAVVGMLVEQKHLRVPAVAGQRPQASNVLYAVPVGDVVERLGLTVAAARPRRLSVDGLPADTVTRSNLLAQLVHKLVGGGPARVIRVWGYGGMGKTTVVRQAVHDARVWRAFPGGIVMVTAGEHASTHATLAELASRLGFTGGAVRDALAGDPTLVAVDDVWSAELVAELAASVGDNVTLVVTTRGTPLDRGQLGRLVESVHVEEMLVDEAVAILARDASRSGTVDQDLAKLAAALGYWPLLLSLAASEIHGDELHTEDAEEEATPRVGAAEVAANARRLVSAFARDPTKLDDPDSQRRSFSVMIERSLGRLSAETQGRFHALAVYPADAELTQPVLADLWAVDDVDSRKTIRGLRRVGLVNMVSTEPITIGLHDHIVAWLHHTGGAPETAAHFSTHRRLAGLAVLPDGRPGSITADRTRWLAFHLCRTGVATDAAWLLGEEWVSAYRRVTSGHQTYLVALRELMEHWARPADGISRGLSEDDATRSILLAGLLHAHLAARVANVPPKARLAEALLGRPEAAMRDAIDSPNHWPASETLVDIVGALARRHKLTPRLVRVAEEFALLMHNNVAQAEALAGLSSVLADSHPDVARRLMERAFGLVDQIQFDGDRAKVLASLAGLARHSDPDRADGFLRQAVQLAERIPSDLERDSVLADVAVAVASYDADHALELVNPLRYRRSEALVAIGRAISAHDPGRAIVLAEQTGADEHWALATMVQALSVIDPQRAAALAERITDVTERGQALAMIGQQMALSDPEGARVLFTQATNLAEKAAYDQPRCHILAAVAAAMAETDPEQARATLDRALEHADRLDLYYLDGPRRMMSAVLRCAPEELDRMPDDWLPYHPDLDDVAARMAVTDPGQARTLLDRAVERIERRIAEPSGGTWQTAHDRTTNLADVAAAMIAFDPRRADELLRRAVKNFDRLPEEDRQHVLDGLARLMSEIDWPPARPFLVRQARRMTRTKAPTIHTVRSMRRRGWVVRHVRTSDPTRTDDYTLGQVAAALAQTDPVWAVELATRAADHVERSRALAAVATNVIATDPDLGRRLLLQAVDLATRAAAGRGRDRALREVAVAILPIDSARAIELAEQQSSLLEQAAALAELATAMIGIDLERAATICSRIPDWARRQNVGGIVAMIDFLAGSGSIASRLCVAFSAVWWDLEATLCFVGQWLDTAYPVTTPATAITGRAVVDMMSRFFPSYLGR